MTLEEAMRQRNMLLETTKTAKSILDDLFLLRREGRSHDSTGPLLMCRERLGIAIAECERIE